ncbi:MAG: hypothetical protein R3B54_16085 [Bdellovibrionota bacterium]
MLVIESPAPKHQPDWVFTVGSFYFPHTRCPRAHYPRQEALAGTGSYEFIDGRSFPAIHIKQLHPYHDYLKKACAAIKDEKEQFLPDIFPGPASKPWKKPTSPYWMGYYCSSAVTPLLKNTYEAAKGAADAALTGADLLAKRKVSDVYALCRPPGHHAGPRMFGGYFYFNNVAVAAHYLSRRGKVAILDIDYHHGDGTQEHFISRSDVFTSSIHGDPRFDFPYVSGYSRELGTAKGKGQNRNFPVPIDAKFDVYRRALKKAVATLKKIKPSTL